MRIGARETGRENAWSALLTHWSGFQCNQISDWATLLGMDAEEVVWMGAERMSDGIRLLFQSDLGSIWVDLTGSADTRLRVAMRWTCDEVPSVLHGEIYSQSSRVQWFLAEPVVIDYLPVMVVSDHDWYDLLMTKIYNDSLTHYIRNFYRLLASPNHQFCLLEAIHLVDTEYSWKNRIPDVEPEAQLLKPKTAEEQFLRYILPLHDAFDRTLAKKAILAEKKLLFQNSLNDLE